MKDKKFFPDFRIKESYDKKTSMKNIKSLQTEYIQQVIYNGNYYFNSKEPIYFKFLWLLDWLFFCTVMFLVGLFARLGIDKIPRKLYRNESKYYVFIQAIGELLLILGSLFLLILLVIKYIPSFAYRSPHEHKYWKTYSGGILLTLGLFLTNPTFANKLRYVFNARGSDEDKILNDVYNCWTGAPGDWPNCVNYK